MPIPADTTAARLHKHVDVLAGLIGERHWWRYDHLMAAEKYVRDQFAATGLAVSDQPYDVMGKTVRNLIAEQPGTKRPDEILILGAHYDSVDPTPGADDNASGIAGVLEVARQLANRNFKRTIRYLAFVNEEPPFYKGDDMGSLRYARACRARNDNIRGMINFEMIGYFDDLPGSQGHLISRDEDTRRR
jgi:acetylornithine deacetylase/succinyl-diaminopimelate desuccinylase-like protein